MWSPDEKDVIRDGFALVTAAHYDDLEGARVIADNCNTRLVAVFLARLSADLLEDLTADAGEALVLLREQHAGD
jgi:hypothetical protein